MNGLKEKQKRFCEEYVIDLNASQAAIRAGYSEKTSRSQGQRMLTNVDIQNYIQELQKEISKRNDITVDECINILANIARVDIAEFYNVDSGLKDVHAIPKEHRQAIASLETYEVTTPEGEKIADIKKLKTTDKLKAVDMLLKHLGGYRRDNEQKTINSSIPLVLSDGRNYEDMLEDLKKEEE